MAKATVKAILMPKFGQTMTEGAIASWERKEGEHVKKGEILLTVESDKALMEVESEYSGYLVKIIVPPGETVPCGRIIAYLEQKD
jgi:pyruvate/2-oxoglutarate dehydrogenase complex dihydrolipoamide acyltransferase (E2) component